MAGSGEEAPRTLPFAADSLFFGATAPSHEVLGDDRRPGCRALSLLRFQPRGQPLKFAAFKASIVREAPPSGLSLALQALWWNAKGTAGDWAHAYLHRRKGDQANAVYWYGRAGQPVSAAPLPAEWEAMVRSLLDS